MKKTDYQLRQEDLVNIGLQNLKDSGLILQSTIKKMNEVLNKGYDKEVEFMDVEVSENSTLADARFEDDSR